MAGAIVAGLLLKADPLGTGWRSLFLINLPLRGFALLVGARVLPRRRGAAAGVRIDLLGTALFALASVLLVFPLIDGRSLGWPAWVFGVLAATVPVLAAFVAHQRHRLAAGAYPAGRGKNIYAQQMERNSSVGCPKEASCSNPTMSCSATGRARC